MRISAYLLALIGVKLHRKVRLRRFVQAILAGALALLLTTVVLPSQKADAVGIAPYQDNSFWVDGTSTHPPAQGGSSYLWPTSGDFTVEIWAKYEGPWTNNSLYTLWSGNGYYLYGKNGNFWFHAKDGSETDSGVAMPTGWFHAAIVGSPTTKTVKLVLNGASTVWSKTFSTFTYSTMANIGSSFMISQNPWNGQLDQLKIFNSSLSDSQIAQSMNVYSNAGITGTPAIFALYDFNQADGSNNFAPKAGTGIVNLVPNAGAYTFKDVKTTDTTSRPGFTIYTFPRTYLPAEGGWKASANASASKYEYLVVAGGGGGGGNRGGGGGAGGLVTGQVAMPFNGVFSIVVGAGGYSGVSGTDSKVTNIRGPGSLLSAAGGGAGGTTLGTSINGYSGGSGGGASLCYITGPVNPNGGTGTAGQGNAGAGNDTTNCASANPENRHTGGGGGAGTAGQQGTGGSLNPTPSTSPMTTPNGGAGASSSISGTTVMYAAGGGGAHANAQAGEGYTVSYQGSGGSGIGGNGAAPGARGADAAVSTGSGGGGGGWNVNLSASLVTGGYGSSGVVVLVAPTNATLSTPAVGAILNGAVMQQPTVSVPTGIADITGCSVEDASGSTVGVSVTCTPVTGQGTSASLTDLTFTSGTPLQYYTLIISVDGYEDIRQEMMLGYQANSITVDKDNATSNFVWDESVLLATSANQSVVVLGSDVTARTNSASSFLSASGAIIVNTGVSATTSGNGVTFKGLTYLQKATVMVSTANGDVTIWSTNPNSPTGTNGVTGVTISTAAYIRTTGGDITIGGGLNPSTSPVTAEVGVNILASGQIQAAGGNISIRGDSVLNSNLNTADHQMKGVLITTPTISTTGSGTITIVANATGSANGRVADAIYLDNGGSISSVNGTISISAGNLGSGNTNGIYSPTNTAITTTGNGSITLVGDSRGSTTASTSAPQGSSVHGVFFDPSSDVTTVNGDVSVTGYGGNFAASTTASRNSYGLYAKGSKILSSGSGSVSVVGIGGAISNSVAGKTASSIGVYNGSWMGTTTGDLTVQGVSGPVTGVAGVEIGFFGEVYGSGPANYWSGSLISTEGDITLTGDTAPNGVAAAGITVSGVVTNGAKIKSTSGDVSVTGTACSTCTVPQISTKAFGIEIRNNSSFPTWHEFLTGGAGTFTLTGRADNEDTTSTAEAYGIKSDLDSATRTSLSTQSGALTLTGTAKGKKAYGLSLGVGRGSTEGGLFTLSGTSIATTSYAYGIATNGYAFLTGAGGFNFSGSGTNTSSIAYGVSITNASATATSGSTTITGNANSTGSGWGIQASSFALASQAGDISLTGNATANTLTTGVTAYGVRLSASTTTTTDGDVTVIGNTYGGVNAYTNYGVSISSNPITTGAGTLTLTGFANGATTSGGANAYGLSSDSALKTSTGAITLSGEVPNLTTSQALGVYLSGSVTSGDAATLTDGGAIAISGKTKMVSGNLQHQINISGGSIDTYNNSIDITAGELTTVANSQRVGLALSGTLNWAATASSLNVTAYGLLGSKALYQDYSHTLNVGGPNSHANITFNVDQWNQVQTLSTGQSFPITNINTDGSVDILPIGTSFGPDAYDQSAAGTPMVANFKPTIRVAEFTIGKPGNTRNLTLKTSSFEINPSSGVLTIFAGTVTANWKVSAGTLAIDSSGTVKMGAATNAFNNVAVKRAVSTDWNLVNSASSWTAGTYGGIVGIYGVPAKLKASGTVPSSVAANSSLASYSVIANDSYDLPIAAANTRSADALTVTASIKTGATTNLGGTTSQTGTAGTAITFSDLSFTTPGIHTLGFDATGYTQYASPNISVSGGTPTLSLSYFSGTNNTDFVSASTTASPTFSSNNTSSATYSSTTTSVCTVGSSTGVITTKTPGTCTITVDQVQDSTYAAGTQTINITINKKAQTGLVISSTSGTYGSVLSLSTSGGNAGSVSYVLDSGTCTLATATTLTLGSAGSACEITATRAGDATYAPVSSASTTITVNKANQVSLVTPLTTNLTYQSSGLDLSTLTITGGNGTGALGFSTASSGCSITGSTLTSSNSVGVDCVVTTTKDADSNYNISTGANFTVTLVKANQDVLTISTTSATYNATLTLTTSGGSGLGVVTFSKVSGTCNISGGILTPTAAGTCIVKATKAASTNYNEASSADTTITIAKANQANLVAPTGVQLTYGDTVGLDLATLSFTNGSGTGSLSFSTATAGCSIVNNILTSTNNATMGCTVATTKSSDTNFNAGNAVNLSVSIVRAAQAPITITSTSGTYGQALGLAATGGSGGGAFTFDVDSGTCSISGVSLTLGAAGSSCMVTATRGGSQNYEPGTSVSTSITTLQSAQAPLVITSTSGSFGQTLSLTTSGGSDSGAVTFVVNSGTCSVSGSTLTMGDAGSSCMVTATKAASTNYSVQSSVSTSISTAKVNQGTLTVTSLVATFGTNLTLTSSGGSSNGSVSYTKVSGPCTISSGVLSPTGAGNCVVTATKAGGTNYNDVTSANATVAIAKANQATLSFSMVSNAVPYLGSLTLTTSGGSGSGTVVFTVTQNSACSNSGTTLTVSDVGSVCEVLATKIGDANYNSADAASVQITTTPIDQSSVSFTSANVLTYGQTLALSAVGGTGGGTISYSVSNPGTTGCSLSGSTLSVTASGDCVVAAVKSASLNYNISASVTQTVTVSKAAQTTTFTSLVPSSPVVGSTYTVSATSTSGTAPTFTIGSGNCSITASVVTFTGTGSCRVDANTTSTNQYLAAGTASQTIGVGQRNQTLTFDGPTLAISSKTYGAPAFVASASSSIAGLTPVYSSGSATTNGACLVSTAGLVTIAQAGVCQIKADQQGDANTAAATSETMSFVVVADIASAPTIVSVSAGHESITAAFMKPSYTGGATVTGYEIVATHVGGQEAFNGCSVIAGNDQSCTITGLTNGTSYTVKVAAITSAGVGLQSASSLARVPATKPAAVTQFTAVPENTTLDLSWGLPISLGGGTFDSYRIFIKERSEDDYPITFTTINSINTLAYQFTNLINGQAYDVKIVTVTTANTLSLVSNTAEVRQTPRTVPDAPATIDVLEVGGSVVITWSAPQSDGGNPISEYRVTVSGTACTLNNALDNLCEIPIPTASGTYPIAVQAKNDAGYGTPATAVFTKAGVPSSGGVTSGGSGGRESATNSSNAIQVLTLSIKSLLTSGGQVVSVTGKNFTGVTTVLVGGVKAKIISVKDGLIKFTAPRNVNGLATLTLSSPTASAEVVDAFTYSKGVAKVKVAWVLGFVQANTNIKAADKAKLRSALLNNPGIVAVTCVGYQSYSYNYPKDAQTAMGRAKQACSYLKSINPKLSVKTVIARTNLTGTPSRKLAVQFKTSK